MKKKEIYTYEAPWKVYAMGWSARKDESNCLRLACGSYREEYENEIRIVQHGNERDEFVKTGSFKHPYPPTKLQWIPDPRSEHKDLMATAADYLRIWHVEPNYQQPQASRKRSQGSKYEGDKNLANGGETCSVSRVSVLNSYTNTEYSVPLTSMDWNQNDVNILGTSSIDGRCTVWDIQAEQAQAVKHRKEVYDIAFSKTERFLFASAGGDGVARLFDMRGLRRNQVLYDAGETLRQPLLRIAWNSLKPYLILLIPARSHEVIVVDERMPSKSYAELNGHHGCVNAAAWAPSNPLHLCSAAEDRQALIWELPQSPGNIEEPILAYKADSYIEQLQWSPTTPEWLGIAFGQKVQILRV